MAHVSIDQVTKQYGETRALDAVCLSIRSGEFVTLLGPSGCGKSTTLRAIAGLIDIDRGTISIDAQDVTWVPIHRRNIGMVFQSLALFPHMTVDGNVSFGLKMRRLSREDCARKVVEALSLVQLPDFGSRYPHQLSGGQQQRVAIARALVINPGVLLLDEPFGALDRKLREEMQIELRELTRRVGITSVFVTHDQEEALTLSDRIVVMNAGRVEQIGTSDSIYSRPETRFVADFMGARNILEARVIQTTESEALLEWQGGKLRTPLSANHLVSADRTVGIAIRPELIRLGPARTLAALDNAVSGRVASKIDQGAFITVTVETRTPSRKTLVVRQSKVDQARQGPCHLNDIVGLEWNPTDLVILRDTPHPSFSPQSAGRRQSHPPQFQNVTSLSHVQQ